MTKEQEQGFLMGVFYAMQYLVVIRDEPTLARELAQSSGIGREWALKESKSTGVWVREMNKFIREELNPTT